MKRFLTMILIGIMSFVVVASHAEELDLSTMTGAELLELRDRIDKELKESHEVDWSTEYDIMDDIEERLSEIGDVPTYKIRLSDKVISNDWGVYKAEASYKYDDSDRTEHTGKIVAEYRFIDGELSPTSFTVDDKNVLTDQIKDEESIDSSSESDSTDAKEPTAIDKLQYGDLIDVTINDIDSIIVIKAKITPSFSNQSTIDQNYYNIDYLVKNYNVDQYKELQYWAVADMTDGSESKVISFDVSNSLMKKIKDGSIFANQLGDHVDNLWLLPSLR